MTTATETPVQRREREALARCRSEKQRERVVELHALGITCYPDTHRGRIIVRDFTRYLASGDASLISNGLYHFATQGAGGFNEIAHFDIHGFRAVFADPATFVALALSEAARSPVLHSTYVYRDGMTGHEVRAEIVEAARNYEARA